MFLRSLIMAAAFCMMAVPMDLFAAEKPIVIAHRGASGFRPEHTLEAYRLGIVQGADFIEPDLVVTKDGVLIARHENELSGTTDVSERPEFADRQVTKMLDGMEINGWWSEDFTLAEIKTLKARERIPAIRPDNTEYNDMYEIPTLTEILDLVKEFEAKGRVVGIYPETKHPTYFAKEGTHLDGSLIQQSLGQLLIDTLVAEGFTDPNRIFIQSFELENLIELKQSIMPEAGVDLPLVQLLGDIDDIYIQPASNFSRPYDFIYNAITGKNMNDIYGELANLITITDETGYSALVSQQAIEFIASYASGLGPWKNSFLERVALAEPYDANDDGVAEVTSKLNGRIHPFLGHALAAGLKVHPYTIRAEERWLTMHGNGTKQSVHGEVIQLLSLGIHGFFIDQPLQGVQARNQFMRLNLEYKPEFNFKK